MASHQIETVLLLLTFIVACMAAITLQAIVMVCRMSLDLQEQIAVCSAPIMTRVKFGKCRCK